jgi:hypothetical protein
MTNRVWSSAVVGSAIVMSSLAACAGPTSGTSDEEGPGISTGAGGAGIPGMGTSGSVATSAGGNAPIFIPPTSGAGGAGDGGLPGGSCGKVTLQGEVIMETRMETRIETRTETRIETRTETRIETHTETREVVKPVALYLMLDQSGSMIDSNKWGAAVGAINTFTADPRSAGFSAALHIFSFNILGNPPGCALCDGSDCRTPMVTWGALPGNSTAIANALNRAPIGIGTPIEAGLRGAILGCQDYESSHPQEDCVAVLITDGAPSTCESTAAGLASIASSAAAQGIPTFAIGMVGADFAMLDEIALGGGTDCDPATARRACNATSTAEFLAALEQIRTTVTQTVTIQVPVEVPVQVEVQVPVQVEVQVPVQVPVTAPIPCEWGIPSSQTNEKIDPNKLNVDFTDRTRQTTKPLGNVPSAAECAGFANGWYYDDPATPKRVIACPEVCNEIKATDAKIDIIVGCETRPAQVH